MTISNAIQPASITFNQTAPASRADSPFDGNGKKGDLLALCRALVAYSDAALAYFTAP